MKIKKVISLLCTAAMLLAVPAGNVYAGAEDQSVVVTMPTTSEPESGFDPAYGWGAGEHVHERGLAAAVFAEQRQDLAPVDIEPDAVIGDDGAEALGDVAHFDRCNLVVQYGVPPEMPADAARRRRALKYI